MLQINGLERNGSSKNVSEHKAAKGSDGSGGRKSLDSEASKISSEKVAGHMTPKDKGRSQDNETQTLEGGSTTDSSVKVTENTTLKDEIEGIGRQDLIEDIPVVPISGHYEDCSSDGVVIDLKT